MKKFRSLLIIAMLAVLPALSFAQPPVPNQNGNGSSVGNTPVGAPIDGGMSILLLLGLGYGVSKTYNLSKKEAKEE
jgi:hypothetical protein